MLNKKFAYVLNDFTIQRGGAQKQSTDALTAAR